MRISSILAAESCRDCRGAGSLGRAAGVAIFEDGTRKAILAEYVIFCETCMGQGMMLRERCLLTGEEDDD